MKTLNWKRTDWLSGNFIFSMGEESVGQLNFDGTWSLTAVYADKQTQLNFAQKSFWERDILVTKDGKTVGEIRSELFGNQTLKLATGESYVISSSLLEQEAYWKSLEGETIVTYRQAAMSSMEKGTISLTDSLPAETEKLLISGGLFARQLARRRIARTVAVMLPIMAAASRA